MLLVALDTGEKYVAGAYVVFVVLLLIYVAIMAARLGTLSKTIEELAELAERRRDEDAEPATAPEPESEEARA